MGKRRKDGRILPCPPSPPPGSPAGLAPLRRVQADRSLLASPCKPSASPPALRRRADDPLWRFLRRSAQRISAGDRSTEESAEVPPPRFDANQVDASGRRGRILRKVGRVRAEWEKSPIRGSGVVHHRSPSKSKLNAGG
jgi:hypothetical protein